MLNMFASCTVVVVDKLTSVAGRRRTRLERAARGYVANVTGVELLRVNRLKVSTPCTMYLHHSNSGRLSVKTLCCISTLSSAVRI